MRVVIDTNVFVSGVFFGGLPGRILEAWRNAKLVLTVSPEVLVEYRRVGAELAARYSGVSLEALLTLVTVESEVVQHAELPTQLCADPADDKFMACALAGAAGIVVSGDRALRRVSGWNRIEVLSPRMFADRYLS